MIRSLVAEHYRWDDYPGLRAGRLHSGAGDLGRHPRGATHAVAGEDAVETLCGLPRDGFPYEFTPTVDLRDAEPCVRCEVAPTPR